MLLELSLFLNLVLAVLVYVWRLKMDKAAGSQDDATNKPPAAADETQRGSDVSLSMPDPLQLPVDAASVQAATGDEDIPAIVASPGCGVSHYEEVRSQCRISLQAVGTCLVMATAAMKECSHQDRLVSEGSRVMPDPPPMRARRNSGSRGDGAASVGDDGDRQQQTSALAEALWLVQEQMHRQIVASRARRSRLQAFCADVSPTFVAAKQVAADVERQVCSAHKAAARADSQLESAARALAQLPKTTDAGDALSDPPPPLPFWDRGKDAKSAEARARAAGAALTQAVLSAQEAECRGAHALATVDMELREKAAAALRPMLAAETAEAAAALAGLGTLAAALEGFGGAAQGDAWGALGEGSVARSPRPNHDSIAASEVHAVVDTLCRQCLELDDAGGDGAAAANGDGASAAAAAAATSTAAANSDSSSSSSDAASAAQSAASADAPPLLLPPPPSSEAHRALRELLRLPEGHEAFVDALNQQRSMGGTDLGVKGRSARGDAAFGALCGGMAAVFDECAGGAPADIRRAKNAIMLSQSFFRTLSAQPRSQLKRKNSSISEERCRREFLKEAVVGHKLFQDSAFWDRMLAWCVEEQLSQAQAQPWYKLDRHERAELVLQVQNTVFSMCASLAHSMVELGCAQELAAAFIARTVAAHQLPQDKHAVLMQHVMRREDA
ncbi:hypothetical protein JKP88DRAFT_262345, partial [Tribonema minus]